MDYKKIIEEAIVKFRRTATSIADPTYKKEAWGFMDALLECADHLEGKIRPCRSECATCKFNCARIRKSQSTPCNCWEASEEG